MCVRLLAYTKNLRFHPKKKAGNGRGIKCSKAKERKKIRRKAKKEEITL